MKTSDQPLEREFAHKEYQGFFFMNEKFNSDHFDYSPVVKNRSLSGVVKTLKLHQREFAMEEYQGFIFE